MMISTPIVFSGSPIFMTGSNQPATLGQSVASFLKADVISPECQAPGTVRVPDSVNLLRLADNGLDLLQTLAKTAALHMATGRNIIFLEPETAVVTLEQVRSLPETTLHRSIVIAPLDGSLSSMKMLSKKVVRQQIGRLITVTPHQHLFAVERLGFPELIVEMTPPVVDVTYFNETNTQRNPDTVLFIGAAAKEVSACLGGKVEVMLEPLVADRARDALRKTAAVVIVAESKSATSGLEPLLWAAACEAPLIVPRTFSLQHFVTEWEDALFYTPGDRTGAVNVARRILSDPGLGTRLGKNARQRMIQVCSQGHMGGRLAAILRKMSQEATGPAFYLLVNQTGTAT